MPDAVPYALQIECIDRELKLRRRVYPRRVEGGQMTQQLADRELERMEAVKRALELVHALYKDLLEAEVGEKLENGEPVAMVGESINATLAQLLEEGRPPEGEQRELF